MPFQVYIFVAENLYVLLYTLQTEPFHLRGDEFLCREFEWMTDPVLQVEPFNASNAENNRMCGRGGFASLLAEPTLSALTRLPALPRVCGHNLANGAINSASQAGPLTF